MALGGGDGAIGGEIVVGILKSVQGSATAGSNDTDVGGVHYCYYCCCNFVTITSAI